MSDFSESSVIAARMQSATRKLHELAPHVGRAKQIREYDADRRKRLLGENVAKFLKSGESAAAAEHLARSSAQYADGLEKLAEQYESAEITIAQWTAEQASYEAARSLLSFNKAIRETMPE